MRTALVPLVLLLSACRGLPEDEAALEGFWQRSDGGDVLTVLAIGDGFSTLADDSGVVTYDLLTGPSAGPLTVAQQGGFELDGEAMLWEVRFDADAADQVGSTSTWELHSANERRFEATDASGERYTWRRLDELPVSLAGEGSFGVARFVEGGLNSGPPGNLRFGDDGTPSVWTNSSGLRALTHQWDASFTQLEPVWQTPERYERVGSDFLQANAGGSLLRLAELEGVVHWQLDAYASVTDMQVVGDTVVALVMAYGPLPAELGGEGPSHANNLALVRISLDTGAVESAQWIGGASGVASSHRLVVLDDGAVVVLRYLTDDVVDPEGPIGRFRHRGLVAAAYEPDGSVRWKRWLGPDAEWLVTELVQGPDNQVVFSGGVRGRFNLGDGLVSTDLFITEEGHSLGMVVALDATTGDLRWQRRSYADGVYSGLIQLASRPDGVLAVAQVAESSLDLGGEVGVVAPVDRDGIVVSLVDACGEAQAARLYQECDCTYEDPNGFAQVWDAEFSPSGDLGLAAFVRGYYRFSDGPLGEKGTTEVDGGGLGENWATLAIIAGPDAPLGARSCPAPELPSPTLDVEVIGEGTVRVGDTPCDDGCSVSGELFSWLDVVAEPAEGMRFAGFEGVCTGIVDCEVALDDSVQSLTVRFEPTVIPNVWPLTGPSNLAIVAPVVAVGASGDVLLGARVQGELTVAGSVVVSDTAGLPGIVMALQPSGDLRWTARLDPPQQGGTAVAGMVGRSDGSAVVLTAGGRLVHLDPTGAIVSDVQLSGVTTGTGLAEDDAGQLVVTTGAGVSAQLLGVTETGSVSWSVPLLAAGSVALVDVVGGASGATALFDYTGATTVGDEVLVGTQGRVLVTVDGSGNVDAVADVPASAPDGVYNQYGGVLQRGGDGGLWLIGDQTRDTAVTWAPAYAEPINTDGSQGGSAVGSLLPTGDTKLGASPMLAVTDGWGILGGHQAAGTAEGFTLVHRGEVDLLVGAVLGGSARSAETLGSAGADWWMAAGSHGNTIGALARFDADGDAGGRVVPSGYVLLRMEP